MSNNEAQARYRQQHPERSRELVRASLSKARFGSNREAAIQRDDEKCVKCGITRIEHRQKFGRDITVDHIDNQGRYSYVKNNNLENLMTLCLPCHGRKDVLVRYERRQIMDENKIDKGVPIPEKRTLLLLDLKVKESILFPLDMRSSVQSRASTLKRETGKEFTVRKVDDENIRVWRTK